MQGEKGVAKERSLKKKMIFFFFHLLPFPGDDFPALLSYGIIEGITTSPPHKLNYTEQIPLDQKMWNRTSRSELDFAELLASRCPFLAGKAPGETVSLAAAN